MSKKARTPVRPSGGAATSAERAGSALPRFSPNEIVAAVLVGFVILLRPWYDGITYPANNAYFLFGILAAAIFWVVRPIMGRAGFPYRVPVLLFAAFAIVAAIATYNGVQYGRSYRVLMNWLGYLVLFATVANGFRSRPVIAIVLVLFVVTSLAETAFSYIHVKWLMPQTRELLMQDPSLLRQYFRTAEMTPAIQHRLESNRATGSLLFANALAAWLILGIPFAIGLVGYGSSRLRAAMRNTNRPSSPDADVRPPAIAAIGAFCVAFAAISTYYTFYFSFAYPGEVWSGHWVRWGVYCLLLPLAAGAGAFLATRSHGPFACWAAALVIVGVVMAVSQTVALGTTYSRGAMIGLAGALLLGTALIWWRGRGMPAIDRRWPAWAGLLIAVVAAWYAATMPPVIAQEAPAENAPAETQAPGKALVTGGQNVAMQDLMNPATATLRLSYWKAGLRMLADYPILGVGPGNFGTMYPRYQIVGGGEVQQAHNDYLQMFCETGVIGFLAFLLFWGYFFLWGLRRIGSEADGADRWLLTGVFCSVVAFLLHAGVDFNFVNPSLATPAFILAGAFFALAGKPDAAESAQPGRGRARYFAIGLIVLVAIAALGQFRVSRQAWITGDEGERFRRFDAARICLEWAKDPQQAAGTKNTILDMTMAELFPDRASREQFGAIWVPVRDGTSRYRVLQPTESLDPHVNVARLQIQDFDLMGKMAFDQIDYWIERSKEADALFPHDPEMSTHIYLWYELLYSENMGTSDAQLYADMCVYWAEQCEDRSPRQSVYQEVVGRALWRRGRLSEGQDATAYFANALEHYRMAAELYPVKPEFWDAYRERAAALADRYQALGLTDKEAATRAEADRARQKADELRAAWAATRPI